MDKKPTQKKLYSNSSQEFKPVLIDFLSSARRAKNSSVTHSNNRNTYKKPQMANIKYYEPDTTTYIDLQTKSPQQCHTKKFSNNSSKSRENHQTAKDSKDTYKTNSQFNLLYHEWSQKETDVLAKTTEICDLLKKGISRGCFDGKSQQIASNIFDEFKLLRKIIIDVKFFLAFSQTSIGTIHRLKYRRRELANRHKIRIVEK